MLRRLTTSLLFALLGTLVACGTPVMYYVTTPEKVIERNAPPRPGYKEDRFKANQPFGKANILWVVDNSFSGEAISFREAGETKGNFQRGYERVSRRILDNHDRGALPFVDVRQQVITTPSNKTATNFLKDPASLPNHLLDLFHVPRDREELHGLLIPNSDSYKGELRDRAAANPFASAFAGLNDPAFAGRPDAQTYVVFVLASRYTERLLAAPADYARTVSPARPIATVSVANVVPGLADRCPVRAQRPSDFLLEQAQVGWQVSEQALDLCGSPESWADGVVEFISKRQSKFRLSFIPEEGEQLTVRTSRGGQLAYGAHFTYDGATNTVTITSALDDGEEVSIGYWRRPETPIPVGGK